MRRWFVPGLSLAAAAWIALLVSAPLLPVPLSAVLYAGGSFLCHQLPDRSFHLQAFQLPVCARCFGLYAGGAVGSAAAWLGGPRLARHVALGRGAPFRWTAAAALPTLVTFALEWGAGWHISNLTRALAGVPLGVMVAFVVARGLARR